METKEDQLKKATESIRKRKEMVSKIELEVEGMMKLVEKLQGIKTLKKNMVVNGIPCIINYNPENLKAITINFATDKEGVDFIK